MVLSLCLSVFVCAESNEPTVVCSPPKNQRSMDDVDWLKSGLEQEKGRQEKFPQLEEIWESCPAQTTDGARFSRAHVITSCVSRSEDVSEADSIPLCATRGKKTGYTSHILGPFFLFGKSPPSAITYMSQRTCLDSLLKWLLTVRSLEEN